MIVDPDFLDHWRTGMVVDALQDAKAPIYILRLWAHCQERRSDTFAMPTRGLKAQCKFDGDAQVFETALIDAGFIERDGESIHVLGWAEKNAALFAAWENGVKGGRPRKTQEKPTGNPLVTHGEPTENPSLTQTKPIREEKRREEEQPLAGFESFWSAWPKSDRKQAKGKCLEAWKKAGAESHAALVLAHVDAMKRSASWTKNSGEFIPAPLVYINQKRWDGAEGAANDSSQAAWAGAK